METHYQGVTGLCTPCLRLQSPGSTQDLTAHTDGDGGNMVTCSSLKGRSLSTDANGPAGPKNSLEDFLKGTWCKARRWTPKDTSKEVSSC